LMPKPSGTSDFELLRIVDFCSRWPFILYPTWLDEALTGSSRRSGLHLRPEIFARQNETAGAGWLRPAQFSPLGRVTAMSLSLDFR
jgi:hypothetical protein